MVDRFSILTFFPIIICNNARVTQIAKSANASVHPVTYYYNYKNKGDTNDLKEVM